MEMLHGRHSHWDDANIARYAARATDLLIDVGTGDGRFVLHTARTATAAIGIDTCREQLRDASRRAPPNALFVIAAAEALPPAFDGSAAQVSVNFPWGSLLRGLLEGEAIPAGLARLARPGAQLAVRLNAEAVAAAGFDLNASVERVRQNLRDAGFAVRRPALWGAAELRAFPSTWAKRLAFGRDPRAVEVCAMNRAL
jgi:16S rRNA (adenine(1408)-N(1))-methyltransferase